MRNLAGLIVGLFALPTLIVLATSSEETENNTELCNAVELNGQLNGQVTFTEERRNNAATIAVVGSDAGISVEAQQIAIAVALVESDLIVQTTDPNALGLFAQAPSEEWGTAEQLQDPATSAAIFYRQLLAVPDWQNLAPGAAAQAVQKAAFPDPYNTAFSESRRIYAHLVTQNQPVDCTTPGTASGNQVAVKTATGSTITVDSSLAPSLQALLNDAAADGIIFGGWGWRSHQKQIELRARHCGGNNNYAIYQRPSSQCRPPTARPGRSNHETGQAVDFTCNGSTIKSRNSRCFRWLQQNAGRYGLRNLPSEPWHWSVTGR